MLPCLFLLIDYWPLRRWQFPKVAIEKWPFFALTILFSGLIYWLQANWGNVRSWETYPFDVRLLNALIAYGGYLRQTVWPVGLAVHYPHPGHDVSTTVALINGGLLVAITAACWWLRKKTPSLLIGWLWFIGTLVPVIGLVQIGRSTNG